MARGSGESRIFFPWERGGALGGVLRARRARPVVVGALVVALVVVIAVREERASRVRRTRTVLEDTRRAVDIYRADHDGGCPPALSAALVGWPRPGPPVDDWGRPLRLACPGVREGFAYELSSDGPDGVPGGLDRIE